jgi:hypothetical protein
MNDDIRKLADQCGFTILNSPLWRAQGEKFLYELLLRRDHTGRPLLISLVDRPLNDDEARKFLE